jgi:hypothetical protein
MADEVPAASAAARSGLIFVSYSSEDCEYVDRLIAFLAERAFRTWTAAQIAAGTSWRRSIRAAMDEATAVVLVMTPAAEASQWVERELLLADELALPVLPLLLSGQVWWWLSELHYENVTRRNLPSDVFVERLASITGVEGGR